MEVISGPYGRETLQNLYHKYNARYGCLLEYLCRLRNHDE